LSKQQLVQIAKLGKVVGLKGYIRLHNLSDFPSQFKKGASFFSDKKNKLTIKTFNKARSIVLFEGFESVELAKELVNLNLYQTIEASRKTCALAKDEFFYFDILKCTARDQQQVLGKVCDILELPNVHLLKIQTDQKLVEKGLSSSFFIPYIDKFVFKIDLEKFEIHCSDEAFFILENS